MTHLQAAQNLMRDVGRVIEDYHETDPERGMGVAEPLIEMARTYALVSIAESLAILAEKGVE